jgi:hypothetical protein
LRFSQWPVSDELDEHGDTAGHRRRDQNGGQNQ